MTLLWKLNWGKVDKERLAYIVCVPTLRDDLIKCADIEQEYEKLSHIAEDR